MRIGILASGGNSPGMNNAVITLVKKAYLLKMTPILIYNGYKGLLEEDFRKPDIRSLEAFNLRGNVAIGCARSPEFYKQEYKQKAVAILKKKKIDVLVVIGGDGSYKGAASLSQMGVKVMGLPGTIDNDVSSTNTTIGFNTCLNTIVNSLDAIRDSFDSHSGICFVEVMGRTLSDLAVNAGIAVEAEAIVTSENIMSAEDFINIANRTWKRGKRSCVFVITELIYGRDGLPTLQEIAEEVSKVTKRVCRVQVVGYVQRGGIVSAYDRCLASIMANHCMECINKKKFNRVMSRAGGTIIDIDIIDATTMPKKINNVKLAKEYEGINQF
jgi:6-phosphofructokinase 1